MLIVMAGLPGCGKSTLARELAERLPAVVLDKDPIRAALFPAPYIEYSTEQDDFCVDVMLQVAAYLLGRHPDLHVILDGRPYARRYQVQRLDRWSSEHRTTIRMIECVCPERVAVRRLKDDAEEQAHYAENRNHALYRRLAHEFEPIREPKLIVNTDRPFEDCLQRCLAYVRGEL